MQTQAITLSPSSNSAQTPTPSSGTQASPNSVGSGPHLGFVVIAVLGFLGLTFLVVGIAVPVFRWRQQRRQRSDDIAFKGKARQIDAEEGRSRGFSLNAGSRSVRGFVGGSKNGSRGTVSVSGTRSTSYRTHNRNHSGPDITSPLLEETRSNPQNDPRDSGHTEEEMAE